MGEFDDYWARAYRGDPAVPHSDPQRLISTWTGAFALGAAACVHHHVTGLASNIKSLPHRHAFLPSITCHQPPFTLSWQDMTMMLDQKRWKKILDKKQQQA
ncbi:hypothetical protein ACQJBY_050008 [Aegilops geniculata]